MDVDGLWGDGRQKSASWIWPWALAQRQFTITTACFLSKKRKKEDIFTSWSSSQTAISCNPALMLHFSTTTTQKYSGCIDTDADPMQLAPMTHWERHEEWFRSVLSNPPQCDTQTWPNTDDPPLRCLTSYDFSSTGTKILHLYDYQKWFNATGWF